MKAIINGKVYTMAGEVLEKGIVLIDGDKIKAVGEGIEVPSEAEVIDAEGKMVMPGIIDAHTHLGLYEDGAGWAGADGNEITSPVTSEIRAIDAINPEDVAFKDAVKGGITSVMTGPGSANVIGGENLAIKTHGKTVEEMIIKDPVGIKAAFGENPKRVYGKMGGTPRLPSTRMGTAAVMRKAFVDAQNYLNKIEHAEKEGNTPPDRDLKNESLARVLKKEIPLRVHAHRADDILTAIRISEEFDFDITLEHCTDGHKVADIIAEKGIPAVIGPTLTSRSKVEVKDKTFKTSGVLVEAGAKVALMTDHPVIPIDMLPVTAGLAVRAGLSEMDALKALTINAAEILGIQDRVGSLEEGKDADVIICDGSPLKTLSKVEKVFINGEEMELETE